MNIPDEVKVDGPSLAALLDWIARQPFGQVYPVAATVTRIIGETQAQYHAEQKTKAKADAEALAAKRAAEREPEFHASEPPEPDPQP